jgi:hypothetical protein
MSINDKYHKGVAYLSRAVFPGQDVEVGIGASGSLYVVRKVGVYPWGESKRESETLHTFDVRRADRDHWHQTKLFLEWLAQALPPGSRDWARIAYKGLRKLHHETKAKEWEQVLPKPIADWAWSVIEREQKGELCCDNARVAQVGNTGQMRRYRAQKAAGCCGFADFQERGPDGKMYWLGFNYGH